MNRRDFAAVCLLLAPMIGLTACSGGGGSTESTTAPPSTTAATNVTSPPPETITVLAGSELKDLEPFLPQIQQSTGVTLQLKYSGTLDGIDRINQGEAVDAVWFSQAKYLMLTDAGKRVKASEKTMLSPVVVGVKQSKARELGWSSSGVSWKDIAAKAGGGQFTFGMTNPASSNSGFSAVVGIASAFAGNPDTLETKDVNSDMLTHFFSGQRLTSGSSGWLADRYVQEQDHLDGLINYEASLIALNQGGQLHEPLTLIYPKEGVVTADYPLVLLNDAKRSAYDRVVAYIKGKDFQKVIMDRTFRRPIDPEIPLSDLFPKVTLVDVPFPNRRAVIDAILTRYLNENRLPAHSYFVLDVSGSMYGERLSNVRKALAVLCGDDPSLTGKFARFQTREKITLISFNSDVNPAVNLEMHSANDPATIGAIRQYSSSLEAGGDTAIYSALQKAVSMAAAAQKLEGPHYYTVVLMTDGENNRGISWQDFAQYYNSLPAAAHVKIFPILFGEGSPEELNQVATLTGGRVFDGKSESLDSVFKQIRGYQ